MFARPPATCKQICVFVNAFISLNTCELLWPWVGFHVVQLCCCRAVTTLASPEKDDYERGIAVLNDECCQLNNGFIWSVFENRLLCWKAILQSFTPARGDHVSLIFCFLLSEFYTSKLKRSYFSFYNTTCIIKKF